MAAACDELLAQSAESDRNTLKFVACIGLELSEHEEAWLTDEVLSIYCRARPTQQERLDLMQAALKWRVEKRDILIALTCPTCVADPRSHDARLFGPDGDGDPVMMNCFQLPRDLTPASLDCHMICLFERVLRALPMDPSMLVEAEDGHLRVRRWTWVIDLYGFGVRHSDPRTSRNLITLLQTAYRGRLKRLVLLDAPTGFQPFYEKVAKPFMKPRTAELIEFVRYTEAPTKLVELVGEDVASVLLAEAAENRSATWSEKSWTTFYGGKCTACQP